MTAALFVLNAGSSSLKFALYQAENLDVLCRGEVADIGREARLAVSGPQANLLDRLPLPESAVGVITEEQIAASVADTISLYPR